MTEQLFNVLKAIETLASGTMKVYGLPSGQGLDPRNVIALACGSGDIIPAFQALAQGQSINLHSAHSYGNYYCLIIALRKVDKDPQNTNMSRRMTKPTKWPVRPAKTQISLGIRPVRSKSSLCAQR